MNAGQQGEPFSERETAHNQYKVSQDSHASALRRYKYGENVDEGFNGRFNPRPEHHISYDLAEARLKNLEEARYHAQKYVGESMTNRR
jgi:hypothetical protein